eukprot:2366700-Prymnesium_polylepis.1
MATQMPPMATVRRSANASSFCARGVRSSSCLACGASAEGRPWAEQRATAAAWPAVPRGREGTARGQASGSHATEQRGFRGRGRASLHRWVPHRRNEPRAATLADAPPRAGGVPWGE